MHLTRSQTKICVKNISIPHFRLLKSVHGSTWLQLTRNGFHLSTLTFGRGYKFANVYTEKISSCKQNTRQSQARMNFRPTFFGPKQFKTIPFGPHICMYIWGYILTRPILESTAPPPPLLGSIKGYEVKLAKTIRDTFRKFKFRVSSATDDSSFKQEITKVRESFSHRAGSLFLERYNAG